jgi:hypothetical protein
MPVPAYGGTGESGCKRERVLQLLRQPNGATLQALALRFTLHLARVMRVFAERGVLGSVRTSRAPACNIGAWETCASIVNKYCQKIVSE